MDGGSTMSIKLISKHRRALMGLAIIWIAIRHSNFPYDFKIVRFFLDSCGYGGVDVFLFLSSFGLYYAYKKESNYFEFIKRRLKRILPYSMTMCFILFLFGKRTVRDFLIDFFGLSIFLRSDWIYWYTSFQLFMYFLTPIYLKIFNKKPLASTLCGIAVVSLICYFLPSYHYVYIYFRMNIFLLGFYFAYLNEKNDDRICIPSAIVMVFGWYMIYYFFHHFGNDIPHVLPMLFIVPGLTVFGAWVLDKIPLLEKPLDFIGQYTFQFYLIHEDVLAKLLEYWSVLYRPGIHFDFLINLAGIILAFIAAVIFKKIIDLVIRKISHAHAS